MILSVSRRTDVPNYYSDWFLRRIQEGWLCVRNPMNPRQVSRIDLSPEVVDCIVFWTKNPKPMMERLGELGIYPYYFQFTLTGYGRDIEPHVPDKKQVMIPVFQELSGRIGAKRVIWRYDPILFTEKYTPEYHLKAFGQIASALEGYTEKCIISFVDIYTKIRRNLEAAGNYELTGMELERFVRRLKDMAQAHGMAIASCAELLDLTGYGIKPNACIDKALIEELTGYEIKTRKDKSQREVCGCAESVEVGTYDTCRNGCLYCYANHGAERLYDNMRRYDAASPILCGMISAEDKVTERKVRSLRCDS